jgi:putative transcriptional regulator
VEFKCKLRVILAEMEIKHGDFAKSVNMSSAAFSAIVNNHTLPSFETVYRICEELQKDMREIWIKVDENESVD